MRSRNALTIFNMTPKYKNYFDTKVNKSQETATYSDFVKTKLNCNRQCCGAETTVFVSAPAPAPTHRYTYTYIYIYTYSETLRAGRSDQCFGSGSVYGSYWIRIQYGSGSGIRIQIPDPNV
jgi:hypothetical protein